MSEKTKELVVQGTKTELEMAISETTIKNLIYVIRGQQVMLDSDLAMLYQVDTKVFNQAVKRNIERFPEKFRFQLTKEEYVSLSSQFVTSKLSNAQIASKIVVIREVQVIIDRDIAELYEIDTKVLKQSVKRNIERFPESFCFELDGDEFADWRSQFVTSKSDQKGLRYAPFAFTEQGVAMLSAVLRSERAIKVSIEIMNAFVQMRHYLRGNIAIANRLDAVENRFNARFVEHDIKFEKIDENFSKIFNQLDASPQRAKEGVFVKGQIFDAYAFFQDIIKTATKEIVIIDGYVDLSVLERLAVKKKNVAVKIFTHPKAELQKIFSYFFFPS